MEDLVKMLSVGYIHHILNEFNNNKLFDKPIVQIIGYKKMVYQDGKELRYRLMIADGITTYQYCVIDNKNIVNIISNGGLEKWSIIKIISYQTIEYKELDSDKNRRLIYISDYELIKQGSQIGCMIIDVMNDNDLDSSVCYNDLNNNNMTPSIQQQNLLLENNKTLKDDDHDDDCCIIDISQQQCHSPKPSTSGNLKMINNDDVKLQISKCNNKTIDKSASVDIYDLTPYALRWSIKGRITFKSVIREYNNFKGAGKLFNFTITDKTGEIKVTAFNEDCERIYNIIEQNNIYLLSKGTIKTADKRYTKADYEITVNSNTIIKKLSNDDIENIDDIPEIKYNFVSIDTILNISIDKPIDLIGVIIIIDEIKTVISRIKNKELKKREITIVDMSNYTICVTLWGCQTELFNGIVGDIFVTKYARLSNYGGKSVSAGDYIIINPNINETKIIKEWYNKLDVLNFTNLTNKIITCPIIENCKWSTLEQLTDIKHVKEFIASGDKNDIYTKCKAIIMLVSKNPFYKCCLTDGCNKKLSPIDQNKSYKCDKCQEVFTTFKYRYKTDIEICDYTASTWTTLWDDKAEFLFKIKPEQIEDIIKCDDNNGTYYNKMLIDRSIIFNSFIFTLKVSIDKSNDNERVKINTIDIKQLDINSYNEKIIQDIINMDK